MFTIDSKIMEKINAAVENKETVVLSAYRASDSGGCGALKCSGSCGVLMR